MAKDLSKMKVEESESPLSQTTIMQVFLPEYPTNMTWALLHTPLLASPNQAKNTIQLEYQPKISHNLTIE